MATRKDLLKAQSFVQQRMVSALVLRDADNPATPLRRLRTATFIGVLIGVLIMAGFGIGGLLLNGGFSKWTDTDSDLVIVDTESGGVFTYRGEEGNRQLRPAANITSAVLLVPDGVNNIKKLKTESMKGVDLLSMQGIPAAPRQLPGKDSLTGLPIRLCSAAPVKNYRALSLDVSPTSIPERNQAFVLVDDEGTSEYLVHNGVKHLIERSDDFNRSPLLLDFVQIRAGNRFVNALPTGTPIKAVTVENKGGRPHVETGGRMIGDIVFIGQEQDADATYYVVLEDGFSRITYLDAMMTESSLHGRVDRETVANATSKTARYSASDIPDGMPRRDPVNDSVESSVCATWVDANKPPVIELGQDTPTWNGAKSSDGSADVIAQEEGSGALLQNEGSLSGDSAIHLIVNRKRYSVPDTQSRSSLGYSDAPVTRVPPQIISLIPDGLEPGDALNYETAQREIGD